MTLTKARWCKKESLGMNHLDVFEATDSRFNREFTALNYSVPPCLRERMLLISFSAARRFRGE